MLKVDLVIPVYNRRETTLKGLKSLSQIDTEGLDVRTIVVDDASPDGTAEAVSREYPDVVLVHGDGNLHYAAGTNRGIEKALEREPDFIVTMNDDAVFHPQFLKRMIAAAESNDRSIIGALLLLWDEPHRVFQVDQKWKTLSGGWVIPEDLTAFSVPQTAFDVECIVGNCVLFPAKAIRENGLMDEKKFPHGWGDAQYLMRMRKAGWRLMIEPKAYVWCEPNTYPEPLHVKGLSHVLRTLFVNERHPLNLKRQFIARWESAPSKAQAVSAFGIYCLMLVKKTLKYLLK
jgi:GT2 family glycosyltransferase